jgi:hypothetical protein
LSDLHEGIGVPRPRALLPLLALFGCPSEPEPATCATGEPATWVIRELTFARRVDGVVEGFDIDGHDSSAQGDALGCGHPDLVDPAGLAGIDNNFSALIPVLEATEAVAAESLVKQSIASGELLLLLSVDGVRSWEGDDCVDFTLSRGDGVPLVGPDGTLLDHQTLVLDPSVAAVQVDGVIDQGRLDADGLSFRLPLDVLNAELDFEVTRGRFALERRGDRLRGVMGGVIPIRQIVEILERDDVNLDQFIPFVEGVADVQDDDGDCSLLSLAFEFEAIPAYIAP